MPAELTKYWFDDLPAKISAASDRVGSVIQKTPLVYSDFFSRLTGANVFLKCENLQTTGSFKLRGATNKYLTLPEEKRDAVVTASTGNHGKAVAYVARKFETSCRIFAPKSGQTVKLEAIRSMGAEVEIAGDDCVQAERLAREFAAREGLEYISPYNDPTVIAGQGTIGVEVCERLESVDAVFASVGGGGMLGGLAAAIKAIHPDCQFVACSPENSCVLIRSLEAGQLLDLPSAETLSDGTAGGVEADSITFELCQKYIGHHALVTEKQISEVMKQFIDSHQMLIEGSAAVAIAGLLKAPQRYHGQNVVVVLCGANVSYEALCGLKSSGAELS